MTFYDGMENIITINRFKRSDQGTFGVLTLEDFFSWTCELPWRNNGSNISCILAGEYEAVPYLSSHFGRVYLVLNVDGRIGILSHPGNVGGDKSLGYKTHTLGCILQGKYLGRVFGQDAITYSRPTMNRFLQKANNRRLKLIIKEVF